MNQVFAAMVANLTVACIVLILLALPGRTLPQGIRGQFLVIGRAIAITSVLLLFVSAQMRFLAVNFVDYIVMFALPIVSIAAGIFLSRRFPNS